VNRVRLCYDALWSGVGLHGLLLVAYRRFLADRFGESLADEVFAKHQRIQARQVYPDPILFELIEGGVARTRKPAEQLLREFGAHALQTFYELHPTYFPPEGARRFLMQLEETVHSRVREMMPGAAPPQLKVKDLGAGRLRISYRSQRNLCPLLAGLLDGTGTHYQTPVRHIEETCMRRGDAECSFLVEVQQTLLPRGTRKTLPPR